MNTGPLSTRDAEAEVAAGARICVIRQHYVPQDTRVLREVTALGEAGYEVDLLCVRKDGEAVSEHVGPVRVRRLSVPRADEGGRGRYVARYAWFFVKVALLVTYRHVRRPYQVVQVNSVPDALVFAAALPRLMGARVLLDLQECMPEFFATKFGTGMTHPVVRLLVALEQASIRFAHVVITPTAQLRALFVSRGADAEKIRVVMDGADETIFRPLTDVAPDPRSFTLISHGTIEERYGLDTAIAAVGLLREDIPGLRLAIYGDGSDKERLVRLAVECRVADRVSFSNGFVPFPELVEAIARADAGLVAMKRDVFRDVTIASKVFDFVTMRVPTIVARTRSMEESFGEECFELFESENVADLARAIRRLHDDPARRAGLAAQAARVAEPYRWEQQRRQYLQAVAGLVSQCAPHRSFRRLPDALARRRSRLRGRDGSRPAEPGMSTAARPSSTRIGVLVLNTRESMGSVQHVHAIIARRLDKDQFSVLVATPPRCDEPMEWDDDPDVTVMRLPLGASLSEARDLRDKVLAVTGNLRLIPSLLRLARRMRREDIRIIHTAVTPRDALVGTLLSYLTGAALLIHWHLSLDRDFAPGTYPLVWRLAFRRASRILAVSEPSRRSLLPLGIHEEKTSVLHNGVDLDRFRPDLDGNPVRREWGISPVTALVLLPGRLRRHKGHADLLEAAALLRERGRDVTVVFVGRDDPPDAAGSSGPYRPELEGSIARLGLDGCVRFVEHRADMPAVMAAADVVAVPSYDDPLPLVVVEAMACARPVVGTSSGGIPELLTDGSTGLLVPPGAPAALADAIQRLLDDAQLRARLSVTARAEVERRFSQERMAERAGDVYRRLAAA